MNIPIISTLFRWYGKKTVLSIFAVILVLLAGGVLYKTTSKADTEDLTSTPLPTVPVSLVANLSGSTNLTLIGEVEAVSQAELKSEAGGRVTAVNVQLGTRVTAGSVIAQLENANERAAVLQAEGAYEAAVAAARQSDSGVSQARNSLATAANNLEATKDSINDLSRDAYTTANTVLLQQIDQFYTNPEILEPRLRIDGRTNTNFLVAERKRFRALFPEWKSQTTAPATDARVTLSVVRQNTEDVLVVVDTFIALLARAEANTFFSEAALETELAAFNTTRANLNSILNSVDTNRTSLENAEQAVLNAEEAVRQAEIGGTSGDVSAANAQVKQALGSLRNAQANLAKTIISTPIAGEVNAINVKVGDFIGAQTDIAVIANNQALEVTAFVGALDRERLTVGDAVVIDDTFPGTITTIANAINPQTKKYEVKIATESSAITNGDTALITLEKASSTVSDRIFIPITAVKFTDIAGSVFTVEEGSLVQNEVEVGQVQNNFVEVTSGLTAADEIVIDARGLVSGQAVEPIQQ